MDIEELAMMLESIDTTNITQSDFLKALEKAKTCDFEDDQKLVLYGLFKQGSVGNVNCPEPVQGDAASIAKWYGDFSLAFPCLFFAYFFL